MNIEIQPEVEKKVQITRHTMVTMDNLDAVTQRLIDVEHPCLKSLGLDKSASKFKNLKMYLLKECVQDCVPLKVLTEGACILKNKVTYYGKMSLQLMQTQAQAQGLPLFKSAEIKYTIDCLKTILSKQEEYDKIMFDNNKSDIVVDDFVLFGRDEVYGSCDMQGFPATILVPSGTYLISGAIGKLYFTDGNSIDTHIRISRSDTKLKTEKLYNDKLVVTITPYAKYPRSMIRIKFLRKGMQEFYGSMIRDMNFDDDIDNEVLTSKDNCVITEEELNARRLLVCNDGGE